MRIFIALLLTSAKICAVSSGIPYKIGIQKITHILSWISDGITKDAQEFV
jgi:hypothetical protein